jgi:hypothetical protein
VPVFPLFKGIVELIRGNFTEFFQRTSAPLRQFCRRFASSVSPITPYFKNFLKRSNKSTPKQAKNWHFHPL